LSYNGLYYKGSLNHRLKLPRLVLKAYQSYNNQKTRCSNKKVRSYRDYGAKGIIVEYSCREFVAWYLFNIKNKLFKDPVVSRIDHSKNYNFKNIILEERSINSKEAMNRTSKNFSYPVIVKENITFKIIDRCNSMKEASIKFGNSFSTVQRQCTNSIKNPKTKYIYEYGV